MRLINRMKKLFRWRLLYSPTISNENNKLELSGIGSPRTVRDLCQLVKANNPSILFLMETKCSKIKLEGLRVKLGFACVFVVEPVGRSGGLAMFWKEAEVLEIQNFSRRHINAIVTCQDTTSKWKLTGFYGHPDPTKRYESWALLRHLCLFNPEPWLCLGDFNEIVVQGEKSGAVLRREGQMDQFREALEDCRLSDLGFVGPKFTWNNCRGAGIFIKERLDRAVANREWCMLYQRIEVKVMAARSSITSPFMYELGDMKRHGFLSKKDSKWR
jgi:hypothetical protein